MAGMPGIVIKVAADTRDAISGLGKVNKALGKTATASQRLGQAARVGFAAVAAGAGAAVAVAVEAVQAYAEDEQSVVAFEKALKNLGMAQHTRDMSEYVDTLQYAANVSDSELRPALSQLLGVTGSVEESQRALELALDIAAGTGNDLSSVVNALTKGYAGNTSGLSRLNAGIDKYILASGDMGTITDALTDKFGGQSEAKAGTLAGSIEGVTNAFGELQERVGQGIVLGSGVNAEGISALETEFKNAGDAGETFGTVLGKVGSISVAFFADALGGLTAPGGILSIFATDVDAATEALNDTAEAAWSAADAYAGLSAAALAAAEAEEAAIATSTTWNADFVQQADYANALSAQKKFMDRYQANLDAGMGSKAAAEWARHHKSPAAWIAEQERIAEAKVEAERKAREAAAKAKAAREKAKREAEARQEAAERLDELWHYVPFDPVRYSRARQIALRRADGRAAQRDARTGSRP